MKKKTLEEKAAEEEKVIVKSLNGERLTGAEALIAARDDIYKEVERRREEEARLTAEIEAAYALEKKNRQEKRAAKKEAAKKKATEKKAEEKKVTEGIAAEVKGATLPNLEEFVTGYSDLLEGDPEDAKNYLEEKLNSQEITNEEADEIRKVVGGATTVTVPAEEITTKKITVKKPTSKMATRFKDIQDYVPEEDLWKVRGIKAAKGEIKENEKTLGKGYRKAVSYFKKYDRVEDALDVIAFDYADSEVFTDPKEYSRGRAFQESKKDPVSKDIKRMLQGTGGENAKKAYEWIQNNLSGGVKKRAQDTFEIYKEDIQRISDEDATTQADEQLAARRKKFEEDYVAGSVESLADAKALGLEFSKKEQADLNRAKKDFEVQKAAERKTKKKKDTTRAAITIAVSKIDVGEHPSETPDSIVSTLEREVAEQIALENTYLSDKERKKLKTLTTEIQELKARELKEEGLPTKDLGKLKNKEIEVRRIRKQAHTIATKTDKLLQEVKDIDSAERARRSELDELYGGRVKVDRYGEETGRVTGFATGSKTDEVVDEALTLFEEWGPSGWENFLPTESLSGLARPVGSTTAEALASNDLEGALNSISTDSADKRIKSLAKKFAPLSSGTKVEIVKGLKNPRDNTPLAGLFDPKTNTIQLDSVDGLNTHAIIHEVSHALGSAELATKGSAFTKRITALYKNTKDLLGNAYGAKSPDEFFSEAMSNEQFRIELARLNPKGSPKSALTMFIDAVRTFLSSKLGLKFVGQSSSALSEVDALVDSIVSPCPNESKCRSAGYEQ